MMRHALLAALAALSLGSAPAFAGEGNGEPFSYASQSSRSASLSVADSGSEVAPMFAGASTSTGTAGLIAASGSEGLLQTANSLPGMSQGWYMTAAQGARKVGG